MLTMKGWRVGGVEVSGALDSTEYHVEIRI